MFIINLLICLTVGIICESYVGRSLLSFGRWSNYKKRKVLFDDFWLDLGNQDQEDTLIIKVYFLLVYFRRIDPICLHTKGFHEKSNGIIPMCTNYSSFRPRERASEVWKTQSQYKYSPHASLSRFEEKGVRRNMPHRLNTGDIIHTKTLMQRIVPLKWPARAWWKVKGFRSCHCQCVKAWLWKAYSNFPAPSLLGAVLIYLSSHFVQIGLCLPRQFPVSVKHCTARKSSCALCVLSFKERFTTTVVNLQYIYEIW